MSLRRFLAAGSILVPAVAACSGCSDKGPTAPPDTGSPLIEVRYPVSATAVDRDSNGLVDLEVVFSDSGTGIDGSSIRLTADRPLKGGPGSGADLLEVWAVARADSAGLVVEETVDHLLPPGEVTLSVSVVDKSGNSMNRSIALDLPPAARHKAIDLQASLFLTTNILPTPDGRRIYVTTEENDATAISVVDAERLEWVKTERTSIRGGSHMALDPARNRLYAMSIDHPFLLVFDLTTEMFLSPIPTSARGIGVAVSHTRGKAYVGLAVEVAESGLISVIDLDQGIEERVINLGIGSAGNPGDQMGMTALVFDEAEQLLYANTSNFAVQGILVVEPDNGSLLERLDLSPESDHFGGSVDMIRDENALVATSVNSLTGEGRIDVASLVDPSGIEFGATGGSDIPIQIATSPDRREYAFTAATGSTDHAVKLMDTGTLEVIWEHRPPRLPIAGSESPSDPTVTSSSSRVPSGTPPQLALPTNSPSTSIGREGTTAMKRATLIPLLALIALAGLIACADEPVAPPVTERTSGPLTGAAAPEEEIFGLVYNNKARITSTGYVVTLQPVQGTGACIYHFTSGTPSCLGSQNMAVNPTGIRPGATEIMWGWYNNLDTDLNPCRPAESNHNERHDENRDGVPDPGIEKHCVKPGKYVVTLQNGATTRTRTIDHRLVKGSMGNGKAIEDTTVSSPTASNFKDTIVHFDVSGGASYTLQKLDSIAIDNPQTGVEFAPGDSVVPTNVRVRINSEVTTPQWDLSIGRLLARTYFDRAVNPNLRSDHWNPDFVVRTHPFSAVRPTRSASRRRHRTEPTTRGPFPRRPARLSSTHRRVTRPLLPATPSPLPSAVAGSSA